MFPLIDRKCLQRVAFAASIEETANVDLGPDRMIFDGSAVYLP